MTRLVRITSAPRVLALAGVVAALWACQENLPVGPETFTVSASVTSWSDTLVVGDTKLAAVRTVDSQSREIQGLHYAFAFADSTIARFTPDAANPAQSTVTALKAGATTASISLPDNRFAVPAITKNLRVVVGGVSVTTAHDTTLTAINDTARVVAASLVRTGGVPTYRPGQGLKWTKRGPGAVTVVGTSDTIRIIAKASGTDTLIASHDYCLAGARCADTVYARVQQTLKLQLSAKAFTAWTFGDTAGPTITLTDRRGSGNALATIRLVPVTAADSATVALTAALGTTNASTGLMAAPKMISAGNGTARVAVVGRNPDGSTADSDTITYVIRQIAVRSSVEPLQIQLTEVDTIPALIVARDVRGFRIPDATFTLAASTGLSLESTGRLTVTALGSAFTGTLAATVTGSSLSSANPGAPQYTVAVDTAQVSVLAAITFTADALNRTQNIGLLLRAPGGGSVANRWVRLLASAGVLSADSTLTDGSGGFAATWTPSTLAGRQIFTALVRPVGSVGVITDSAGLIVMRRSVSIAPGLPAAANSNLTMRSTTLAAGDTSTIVVRIRDAFNNLVTNVSPADFTTAVMGGVLGAMTCDQGVCTALYTATTAPLGRVEVRIGGVLVTNGLIGVAIVPGTPAVLAIVTQPVAAAVRNAAFATQPVLQITDAYNNLVNTNAFTVTATKTDVVAGATLSGTVVVTSAGGVVTFTNLGFAGGVGGEKFTVRFSATDGTLVIVSAPSVQLTNP